MKEKTLMEIQKEYGITRRAVQGYEKIGLIHYTSKTKRGYLLYDEKMVEKIRSIRIYQQLGFSLKEIVGLYSLKEGELKACLEKKLAELRLKHIEIDNLIAVVEDILATL